MSNKDLTKQAREIDYKILVSWPRDEFEKVVLSYLEAGWELVGGPFIYHNNFCQAVTRKANFTLSETKGGTIKYAEE